MDRVLNRTQARALYAEYASGVNIVLGAWLIVAPFVLNFGIRGSFGDHSVAISNSVIVGIAIAVLAAIRVFTPLKTGPLSWINILLGLWLLVSPLILSYPPTALALWNNIVVGMIVVTLAVFSAGEALGIK